MRFQAARAFIAHTGRPRQRARTLSSVPSSLDKSHREPGLRAATRVLTQRSQHMRGTARDVDSAVGNLPRMCRGPSEVFCVEKVTSKRARHTRVRTHVHSAIIIGNAVKNLDAHAYQAQIAAAALEKGAICTTMFIGRKCCKILCCFGVAQFVYGIIYTAYTKQQANELALDPRPSSIAHQKNELKTFSFPEHDILPHHQYLKSLDEIKNATWVTDIYVYLQSLDKTISSHVNSVFGDFKHRTLVLNWVVAATLKLEVPLHNVLVLSLQQQLCDFLANSNLIKQEIKTTCIAVPVDTILSSKGDDLWRAGMMIRPIILRLINYWGYDVATYDTDAVPLKNPQELYQQHYTQDILSSSNNWPKYPAELWGFTLCAGAILYRSSVATGM